MFHYRFRFASMLRGLPGRAAGKAAIRAVLGLSNFTPPPPPTILLLLDRPGAAS